MANLTIESQNIDMDLSKLRPIMSPSDYARVQNSMHRLDSLLELAVILIDANGWVSRERAAIDNVPSTAEQVIELLARNSGYSISSTQISEISEAVEWIRSVPASWIEDSEYNSMLSRVCSEDTISGRSIGIAVTLIPSYRRWQNMLATFQRASNEGRFIGVPEFTGFWPSRSSVSEHSEESEVELLIDIIDISEFPGKHGKAERITFVDKWSRLGHFTNNPRPGRTKYQRGHRYQIRGIVREHRINFETQLPESMIRKVHCDYEIPVDGVILTFASAWDDLPRWMKIRRWSRY